MKGNQMSKCPNRLDSQHVYMYTGGKHVCKCGRYVEYDVIERDFKMVDPK